MICGKAQQLLIKKALARTPIKIGYYRRQLREHVQKCKFCQKEISKRLRTILSSNKDKTK